MLSFSKIYFCCMSMCVPVYVLGCVWCVYVSLSVCVCVSTTCMPGACRESRQKWRLIWRQRQLWTAWCGGWELNLTYSEREGSFHWRRSCLCHAWRPKLDMYKSSMIAQTCTGVRGPRGRRVRNSRSSSDIQKVWGQILLIKKLLTILFI